MNMETIGSNGFAQAGQPLYDEKQEIEGEVLKKILLEKYPKPEILNYICFLSWHKNLYDAPVFYYYDLVVKFHDEVEDDEELCEQMWDWINDLQSIDLENIEITAKIRKAYMKKYPMTKLPPNDFEQGLQAV